jgi:H+/gluconate symporter-like permease
MTNKTGAYIVFGCIAGIIVMIIAAYYWYYVKKPQRKIVPTNEPVFV